MSHIYESFGVSLSCEGVGSSGSVSWSGFSPPLCSVLCSSLSDTPSNGGVVVLDSQAKPQDLSPQDPFKRDSLASTSVWHQRAPLLAVGFRDGEHEEEGREGREGRD